MPGAGETPRVEELIVVDRNAVFDKVFGNLVGGNFPTCLSEEAQERFAQHLIKLNAEREGGDGSFFVKLSLENATFQPEGLKDVEWAALHYTYEVDEDGDLCIEPHGLYTDSNEPGGEELLADPDLNTFSLEWNDVIWTVGYLLLLKETTYLRGERLATSLPHPN